MKTSIATTAIILGVSLTFIGCSESPAVAANNLDNAEVAGVVNTDYAIDNADNKMDNLYNKESKKVSKAYGEGLDQGIAAENKADVKLDNEYDKQSAKVDKTYNKSVDNVENASDKLDNSLDNAGLADVDADDVDVEVVI